MTTEQLRTRVARLTRILLDSGRDAAALRPEVVELAGCLVRASGHVADDVVTSGETRTTAGLALSPSMAAMCIDDYVRTIAFLRGVHEAVESIDVDRRVRVLYVGCGPLATIVAPLLTILDPDRWTCRWIDIHDESVACARRVAATLDRSTVVEDVSHGDALELHLEPEALPDVIVLEILQAALEHEPQVALTRHLLGQAPRALLVPERIDVSLEWTDVGARVAGEDDAHRVDLGTAFTVDREITARTVEGGRLEGATLALPDPLPPAGQPMLCTRLQVFGAQTLGDFESGLTVPRILPGPSTLVAGAQLRFRYRLGDAPGLEVEAIDSR